MCSCIFCVLPQFLVLIDRAGPDDEMIDGLRTQLFRLLIFLEPGRIYSLTGLFMILIFQDFLELL
jgi:hypothetical protein